MKTLDFVCNCCGTTVRACSLERIDREVPSCPSCGSNVRFRSIIHLLSVGLHGQSIPLPQWPVRKSVRGIGLSDWSGYAVPLAEKTDYLCTYFHQEPQFDCVAPRADFTARFDYMISSDVFEHVVYPPVRAFEGARKVLRPGGVLVLTVPFGNNQATVEHFPDLHTFRIVDLDGEFVLLNKRKDGGLETFRDLIFHGGPGTTLEMRVFCRDDVLTHLKQAGFRDVQIMSEDVPRWGIIHRVPWSLPIVARA